MLPIWKPVHLRFSLPKPEDYPYEVTNLAEAIKKKRMDLKLSKVELAQILNVTPQSIGFYEHERKKPLLYILKRILDWLEYVPPLGVDETTLGGQLFIYRIQNGYRQKDISNALKMDRWAITKIENDEEVKPMYIEKVRRLLEVENKTKRGMMRLSILGT